MRRALLASILACAALAAPAAAQDDHAEPYETSEHAEPGGHEPATHDAHEPGAHEPGAHEPGAHGPGAREHHLPVNWLEFVFSLVNFAVWLGIIVLILRKPLVAFLSSRRVAVVEGLEESKRLKAAAEAKYEEYSDRLAHLDEELEKLRKEMIQAGEAERDRIIAEAETRAARMRRDAQFLIDQQMKQLRVDLTREAIEGAVAAAEDMLRRETANPDQQRLADDYLKRLGEEVRA